MRIGIAVAGAAGAVAAIRRSLRLRPLDRSPAPDRLLAALPQFPNFTEMLPALEKAFATACGYPLAILLRDIGGLRVRHHSAGFVPADDELGAAAATVAGACPIVQRRSAGPGYVHFFPLSTWKGVSGAFGFRANCRRIQPQQKLIVQSFVNQVATAVLREHLAGARLDAERLESALLDSIAHNVRTPLASVIGVLGTLEQDHAVLSPAVRSELLDTARHEAERLNRLVGNLLDLSRLESGALRPRTDLCDVEDVVGAALEQLAPAARRRNVEVRTAAGLPPVRLDFGLILQVLVNLLDNAFKYSPEDTPVAIEAHVAGQELAIAVSDEGDGIPEAALPRVFEKFDRAGRTGETGGLGLGLAICKGLIGAHHGRIWAERRRPRGTTVAFRVPIAESW